MSDPLDQLASQGFALLRAVFTPTEVETARESCARALAAENGGPSVLGGNGQPPSGARNLLRLWPKVVFLVRKLAEPLLRLLGPQAGIVRGLYFDKPPGSSWALPWHRDLTIAVKQHGLPSQFFSKPTLKADVPHVVAAPELLAAMLSARIHLDPMTRDNGPLRLIPRSHTTAAAAADESDAIVLQCAAGDVLLMRPMLLHASGHAQADHRQHRRIVHLELAASPTLPDGFEWYEFVAIGQAPIHEQ